jgi:hypothetical protein
VVVGVALFVLAVVLPLLRQDGVPAWRTVWAEDGEVYLEDVITDGLVSLFRGSDGYLQFAPRLLMAPAALVPLRLASAYVAFTAAIFTAAIATLVYRWTRGWIRTVPVRSVVAGFYVLAPAAGWETTGNFTNVIWPLLGAAPWALVARRAGRVDIALRAGVVVLAALSHPLTVVFVPLALGLVWWRRRVDSVVVAVALVTALVAQAGFMAVSAARHPSGANAFGELFTTVSVNTLGSFLLGETYVGDLWVELGVTIGVVFTAVTAVVFAVLAARASRASRRLGLILVLYAGIIACGPVWSNGTSVVVPRAGVAPVPIQRYVVVPAVLLVGAAGVLVDPTDASRGRLEARVGRPALVAHSVIVIVMSFSLTNPRSAGPAWPPEVFGAREACRAGAEEAALDITPGGWRVVLPCERIPS